MIKDTFKDLYKRYMTKVTLKSLFYALLFGLLALVITSTIFWILGSTLYWISFLGFLVVTGIAFLVSYLKLKPTEKEFMKMLDEQGLAQRAITMLEFQEDDSLMASLQRENATEKINELSPKSLSLKLPIVLYLSTGIVFAFAIATSTMSVLSANEVVPSISQQIKDKIDEVNVKEYEVSYEVEGEGIIDGDIVQIVVEGEDAIPVFAEPEEGWYFDSWVLLRDSNYITNYEGYEISASDPFRLDTNIKENLTYVAVFRQIEEDEFQSGEEDPKEDAPSAPDDAEGGNSSEGESQGDSSAGGRYEENNQVIDGETYYGDSTFENARNDAMDSMQGDDSIPDDVKKIISDYFDTIEK